MASELKKKIQQTARFINSKIDNKPKIGVILGTGLGSLAGKVRNKKSFKYSDLPNFPVSTVKSHKGELVFGKIGNKEVVLMDGRFHFYEGYSLEQITFPVRVFKALGAKALVVTNAAGGLNPLFKAGDIMIVTDHINFTGVNPLIGPNDDTLGPRFPDMSQPYDRKFIKLAEELSIKEKLGARKGVFLGLTGPNLETAAEYRFLKMIGADAVAMSMVPEIIVAVHAGLRSLGVSVITDMCLPDALEPTSHEKIIGAANEAAPKLTKLVFNFIEKVKL
jgi:purine-nucleoside phosphorylase